MDELRGFEAEFGRRLRAELDMVVARRPLVSVAGSPARLDRRVWIARPLAVALIAALALGILAATVTRSPDPAQWVQPAAWQRALGSAPPPSGADAASPPAQVREDPPTPAATVTEEPSAPAAEPSERPPVSEASQPGDGGESGGVERGGG